MLTLLPLDENEADARLSNAAESSKESRPKKERRCQKGFIVFSSSAYPNVSGLYYHLRATGNVKIVDNG